jgi:hypothetical protein
LHDERNGDEARGAAQRRAIEQHEELITAINPNDRGRLFGSDVGNEMKHTEQHCVCCRFGNAQRFGGAFARGNLGTDGQDSKPFRCLDLDACTRKTELDARESWWSRRRSARCAR